MNNIKLIEKGNILTEATIMYTPPGVTDIKGMPVFIYLHGKGEYWDGSVESIEDYQNNEAHLPNWLSSEKGLKIGSEYYWPPFVILMPLMPKDVVLELERQLRYIDSINAFMQPPGIGIGGISFGGKGTVLARVKYPDRFKCFLPMAAAYQAKEVMTASTAPMWSHHGAKDTNVHPNWSIWNSEYAVGVKGSLERDFNLSPLSSVSNIEIDINAEWDMNEWVSLRGGCFDNACTIYAGKGHGIQYLVLHQKRVWDFLEYHLGIAVQQPENPFEKMEDGELIIYGKTTAFEKLPVEYHHEIYKRGDEVKKKYNLS